MRSSSTPSSARPRSTASTTRPARTSSSSITRVARGPSYALCGWFYERSNGQRPQRLALPRRHLPGPGAFRISVDGNLNAVVSTSYSTANPTVALYQSTKARYGVDRTYDAAP